MKTLDWREYVAVLVVLAVAGCGAPSWSRRQQAEIGRARSRVEVDAADTVTATVTATGTIRAEDDVRSARRRTGACLEVPARVGDSVAEGDVLVQLDDELAELGLQQAEAQLLLAEADSTTPNPVSDSSAASGRTATSPTPTTRRPSARQVRRARRFMAADAGLAAAERQLRNTEIEHSRRGTRRVHSRRGRAPHSHRRRRWRMSSTTTRSRSSFGLSEDQVADVSAGPARRGPRASASRRELRGYGSSTSARRADDMTRTYPVRVVVGNARSTGCAPGWSRR